MRLVDLNGHLVKRWVEGASEGHSKVDTVADADGVFYLCPKCFGDNNGPVGTHGVLNWFVGKVPDDLKPLPGRWVPSGNGIDDLTFIGPAAASVLLQGGCGAHFFVRNGAIELC